MVSYRYPLIARESWAIIGILLVLNTLLYFVFGPVMALPGWFLIVAIAILYRDPRRQVPASPLGIVAPVDGTVVAVEKLEDHLLNRSAQKISIAMNWLSVYSCHCPMEGQVMETWFDVKPEVSAETVNKLKRWYGNITHWIQSDEGDDVLLKISARSRLQRILMKSYLHSGHRIGQGQRCGHIPFGQGQVDVVVPGNAVIDITLGSHTEAGTTVIATLAQPNIG